MSRTPLRLGLATHLALLAALGLSIMLPLLDQHAAELSPWHQHLVLGAGDKAEWMAALARHQHGAEARRTHQAGPPGERPAGAIGRATVLNLAQPGSLILAAGTAGDLAAPPRLSPPHPLSAPSGWPLGSDGFVPARLAAPPPKPPPRSC